MARRLLPLTPDLVAALPSPCDTCVFWELGPPATRHPPDDPAAAKRGWLEVDRPGLGGLRAGRPGGRGDAGYALYAPRRAAPRAAAFPTSPPGEQAALLLVARVRRGLTGQGLGRLLVQGVAREVTSSGHQGAGGLRRGDRLAVVRAALRLPRRLSASSRSVTIRAGHGCAWTCAPSLPLLGRGGGRLGPPGRSRAPARRRGRPVRPA